ncbi:ABC transporter permease [Pseudonocardia sp. MH-G8]|uniref:ABC transporter permease n=1 Tax=Pseudonocardia sp. MH-G8 TaxID=1854588 RepID=UPI001E51A70E|nr:ABC transporter permease [Pseudonocardia sp. MH-G8]
MRPLHGWPVVVAALVLGELGTRVAAHPFFPPPSTVLGTAAQLWLTGPPTRAFLADPVFDDVLPSLARALGGWGIAAVLGVACGVLLGRSRTALDYVGPLFAFARAIPPPTLIPVFLVLFGIGTRMQLATIVFATVWPILLNTVDGVRSLDRVQVDTARSLRTPRAWWLGMVVLPAALPKIFAGLRLSLSLAVILMVVSELVGAANGIGYELLLAQRQFDFPLMWAWIGLLGVLGYGLNALLLAVERRALHWTALHTTAQRSTAQHGTAQHGTRR